MPAGRDSGRRDEAGGPVPQRGSLAVPPSRPPSAEGTKAGAAISPRSPSAPRGLAGPRRREARRGDAAPPPRPAGGHRLRAGERPPPPPPPPRCSYPQTICVALLLEIGTNQQFPDFTPRAAACQTLGGFVWTRCAKRIFPTGLRPRLTPFKPI